VSFVVVAGPRLRSYSLVGVPLVFQTRESPKLVRPEPKSRPYGPTDGRAPCDTHDKMFVAVLLLWGALSDKGLPFISHSLQEQGGWHYIHRTVLTFTPY
jgi:hypothetical protein